MPIAAVLTPDQLRALASPVRNEVYVRLRARGRASAADLGRELAKSPESVHYHLRLLERSGLIREAFRRPTQRKPESVYEPTALRVRLPDPRRSPKVAELNRRAVLAGMRMVMRGYAAASERAEKEPARAGMIHAIRLNLRLGRRDAKEFFRRIEELARFADERRAPEGEGEGKITRLHWHSIVYPPG
jgi:DNA-binding transcriptional ArsR family regulator